MAGTLAAVCVGLVATISGEAARPIKGWPPKDGIKTPGVQIPFSTLKPEAEIVLPAGLAGGSFDKDAYFATVAKPGVVKIDGKTNKVGDPLPGAEQSCGGLADAFGSWWVADCGKQSLFRVDRKTSKVAATLASGAGPGDVTLASTADSVWLLVDGRTTLARIDPESNTVVAEIRLPEGCQALLAAETALWAACPKDNRVLRVDPLTNLVTQRIEVPGEPHALASGEGALWVLCRKEGKVLRIDPKTNKVAATVELKIPGAAGSLVYGEGSLWVSVPGFPLTRIDPKAEKERVAQQFAGDGGGWVRFGAGSVWVGKPGDPKVLRFDPKRVLATLAD